jgi:hypothetical protein
LDAVELFPVVLLPLGFYVYVMWIVFMDDYFIELLKANGRTPEAAYHQSAMPLKEIISTQKVGGD